MNMNVCRFKPLQSNAITVFHLCDLLLFINPRLEAFTWRRMKTTKLTLTLSRNTLQFFFLRQQETSRSIPLLALTKHLHFYIYMCSAGTGGAESNVI